MTGDVAKPKTSDHQGSYALGEEDLSIVRVLDRKNVDWTSVH